MNNVSSLFIMSMLVEPASGHLLAGTSQGVLRSEDAGRTWTLVGEDVTVMALTEGVEAGFLLAGRADGVAISGDGGATWQASLISSSVSALVRAGDARGEPKVLAGTERDGIYRSLDDGRSWQPALAGLRSLEVLCLTPSPGFAIDNTVYAGTASGLHRSRNGGKAWRPISLGVEPDAVLAIVAAPDSRSIWVGTESRGLFVSADDGMTWEHCLELGDCAVGAITVVGCTVIVVTETAIWTCEAGEWQSVARIAGVLCLLTTDDRTVLVGTAGSGLLELKRDGNSWSVVASEIRLDPGRLAGMSR